MGKGGGRTDRVRDIGAGHMLDELERDEADQRGDDADAAHQEDEDQPRALGLPQPHAACRRAWRRGYLG